MVGAVATVPSFAMRAAANNNSKLRIMHIGVGGVGGMQRGNLKRHPKVEFAFLCDVDSKNLDRVSRELPKATQVAQTWRRTMSPHDARATLRRTLWWRSCRSRPVTRDFALRGGVGSAWNGCRRWGIPRPPVR